MRCRSSIYNGRKWRQVDNDVSILIAQPVQKHLRRLRGHEFIALDKKSFDDRRQERQVFRFVRPKTIRKRQFSGKDIDEAVTGIWRKQTRKRGIAKIEIE